jgi:Nitrile hydratase, alpha chain
MSDQQWTQIVARAWADDKFKKRLLTDRAAVLKENGIDVPAGVAVKVVENTAKVCYLTLPAKPSGELSEEELLKVTGGADKPKVSEIVVTKTQDVASSTL